MKVIDKNKNKAVEVDSVSNNGGIYHVYDEGNQYRLFKDEVQAINQETCDHEYEAYAYQTGPYPTDIEMAGHCKKCGYDTHEQL
ncbi:TPA: hypothetical protein I0F96_RS05360 [Enterococcus faecalis]|nr:hypothetical protein [Enterococcus faecalis]HBI1814161.1 hypothetical protein [Enterococcus faecalis]